MGRLFSGQGCAHFGTLLEYVLAIKWEIIGEICGGLYSTEKYFIHKDNFIDTRLI